MRLALGDGVEVGAERGGVDALKDEVFWELLYGEWVVSLAGPVDEAVELWVLWCIVFVLVLGVIVSSAVGVDVTVREQVVLLGSVELHEGVIVFAVISRVVVTVVCKCWVHV